jgi:hypothetical protein
LLIRAKDLLFGAKAAANGDAKTRKPGVEAAVAATGSRYALAKLLKISKVAVQKMAPRSVRPNYLTGTGRPA